MRITKQQEKNALNWFFRFLKETKAIASRRNRLNIKTLAETPDEPFIGDVFLFADGRHKDPTAYWNLFPIVIPVRIYGDGFLGLNLHYTEHKFRFAVLKKLIGIKEKVSPENYSEVSFRLLRPIISSNLFKRMITYYPAAKVKSELIRVPVEEWLKIVYMPHHDINSTQGVN